MAAARVRAESLPSASNPWRKDAIAGGLAAAAAIAIVTNAAFLQSGPHPAPLFAAKPVIMPMADVSSETGRSVRVVGQEFTGPAVTPRARPAEIDAPRAEPQTAPRTRAEIVSDIQRELARRGFYDGAVDGVHGPKTDAAMRDFEQASGLKPGSEANEVFLRAITRSSAKASPVAAPVAAQPERVDPIADLIAPSSRRVMAVQRALADFGYGRMRPNGVFGPETKEAIEQFERARKMPVTGQISPRLLRDLSVLTGRQLD